MAALLRDASLLFLGFCVCKRRSCSLPQQPRPQQCMGAYVRPASVESKYGSGVLAQSCCGNFSRGRRTQPW
ncbi:hypothetical protein PF005_g1552 [Phytophthora fragariae]|uniref:Secreted protein n=1 Tax=Phytophthora fragariae TaxID=53985 RepID=A0A6A3ZEC5_9STRA|nr:hypothetical protein PF003_g1903 [Phytophthora fragariae]KAE8945966.1 hypothetical protein PF009_g4386 [Phytophthora fragariae]KAE9006473.1 hypothetical protein PF011_g11564 [Phytophthora fragariae]KAE9131406.1 hypothetical protein PF010_g3494 [Phytophthora fragariae]KAE9131505.1 hypothetical protein PF007_g4115 [Phytophthora fragariae]